MYFLIEIQYYEIYIHLVREKKLDAQPDNPVKQYFL